jgi:hypothetical protein
MPKDKTDDELESYWALLKPIVRGKGRRLNLEGKAFYRLTVDSNTGRRTKSGSALWACTCVCGKPKEVSTDALMRGKVKSCGCLLREARGRSV